MLVRLIRLFTRAGVQQPKNVWRIHAHAGRFDQLNLARPIRIALARRQLNDEGTRNSNICECTRAILDSPQRERVNERNRRHLEYSTLVSVSPYNRTIDIITKNAKPNALFLFVFVGFSFSFFMRLSCVAAIVLRVHYIVCARLHGWCPTTYLFSTLNVSSLYVCVCRYASTLHRVERRPWAARS